MNKLFILLTGILLLAACSGQRYAFRKTIPVDRTVARNEAHKPSKETAAITKKEADQPLATTDSSHAVQPKANPTTAKPVLKNLASASALREIIPFHIDQLSPAETHPDASVLKPSAKGDLPIMPFLAFVFAVLSVLMLLLVIFISSYTVGIILLFAAPAFAALGLILGISSISDNNGKELAMAAVIISGIVLLIMLIVLMVSYLFLQSRNK